MRLKEGSQIVDDFFAESWCRKHAKVNGFGQYLVVLI